MRIPALFGLLFSVWLIAPVPARAQSQSESMQSQFSQLVVSEPATNLDLLRKHSEGAAFDQYRLPQNWRESLDRVATDDAGPARDEVCYTLRSYKLPRAERFTDSNDAMQYSTCQPSSRFSVREAEDPARFIFP